MILGIGTDLVNIDRVRKVLDRFGDRFEKRVFSELEIHRSRRKYDPSSSYAKRWAAKEACSKALGIGLRMGISWKEMHIVNLRSGKPELLIEGKAKDFLKDMTPKGYSPKINVSLTDDYPWAKAIVIIEGIA
jgi:holo-[acyl-carrier protein] synthase|tara:strand:- start:226 stop:621 length:396 start_codon:yes stop_codon:yes gene_type:complete